MNGQYFGAYLLGTVKLQYSFMSTVGLFNIPILIFTTPLWVKLINRISWFPAFSLTLFLYGGTWMGFAFVTAESIWIYVVATILVLLCSPGLNIVIANMAFHYLPSDNQTVHIAFYATATMIGSITGSSVSMLFMSLTNGRVFNILGHPVLNIQILMFAMSFMMLILSIYIYLQHAKDKI